MHEYIAMLWVHHANKLPDGRIMPLEVLTEPIETRIAYINTEKPERERAVRLHAMRPVKGQLPEPVLAALSWFGKARDEYNKACAELDKACDEWNKARAEWDRACAERDRACAAHYSEIMALHVVECADVKWNEKGLIFNKQKRFSLFNPIRM